jgi:murein L,D-transpeptidase YafK
MRRALIAFPLALVAALCAGCGSNVTERVSKPADKILIIKSAHTLTLLSGDQVLRTYKVALGRSPVGSKLRKGDHKTPEGEYEIDAKKEHSRFYRALHISYPNTEDRKRAQANGDNPGGDIEIHGIENGLGWIGRLHRSIDWTDGCIALTDAEMNEIWNAVTVGTPVEIKP